MEPTTLVYLGIDDWLNSPYFPNGRLKFASSDRQQWNSPIDFECSFAHFLLCLSHVGLWLSHARNDTHSEVITPSRNRSSDSYPIPVYMTDHDIRTTRY